MASAQTPIVEYLEHIQRSVYLSLDRDPTWMHEDHESFMLDFVKQFYETHPPADGQDFDAFLKLARNTLLGNGDAGMSKYQDPAWHDLLSQLTSQIHKVLAERGTDIAPRPIFGSLPTGRVNGMALKVPRSDDFLIIIEEGLFGFANLAAKAVSRVFPFKGTADGMLKFSTDEKDVDDEFRRHPEICERYRELLFAYLVGGHPHLATPYLPEKNYDTISSLLREAMELFVVGHEYGHLLCGHLESEGTKRAMLGNEAADEVATNWHEEFEADIRGLELMIAAMQNKGMDLSLSFWGADFFFGCIDSIERAVSILQTGAVATQLSTTHPPTAMRREMLYTVLTNAVPEGAAEGPLSLARTVQSILDRLWDSCEPYLLHAHASGVELAPAWRTDHAAE